ncbi:hypothetical protein CD178_02056 [Komagataeibacter saccharivorans]|uniref:Uncharacterized protein n=2 Tax=Komagataeibacter TaxID=1434011 RepID=A0A347WD69_9PROT|nr:hypothetical protein CD178_02056 [Komagataeibacter saccharivorans]KPH88873.1 hypothetical protein GLUCOINTEAF2_0200002 [Komagataeibacter intermedius AF2]
MIWEWFCLKMAARWRSICRIHIHNAEIAKWRADLWHRRSRR